MAQVNNQDEETGPTALKRRAVRMTWQWKPIISSRISHYALFLRRRRFGPCSFLFMFSLKIVNARMRSARRRLRSSETRLSWWRLCSYGTWWKALCVSIWCSFALVNWSRGDVQYLFQTFLENIMKISLFFQYWTTNGTCKIRGW